MTDPRTNRRNRIIVDIAAIQGVIEDAFKLGMITFDNDETVERETFTLMVKSLALTVELLEYLRGYDPVEYPELSDLGCRLGGLYRQGRQSRQKEHQHQQQQGTDAENQ